MTQPTFFAIFYDLAYPKVIAYAMHKRIDSATYTNITDDMGPKEVQLKTEEGDVSNYRIMAISTFNIANTMENRFYVVCDCRKAGNRETENILVRSTL